MAMPRTRSASHSGEQYLNLIGELATALELCLACDGHLTWSAEHDARLILERARKIAGCLTCDDDPEKRHA